MAVPLPLGAPNQHDVIPELREGTCVAMHHRSRTWGFWDTGLASPGLEARPNAWRSIAKPQTVVASLQRYARSPQVTAQIQPCSQEPSESTASIIDTETPIASDTAYHQRRTRIIPSHGTAKACEPIEEYQGYAITGSDLERVGVRAYR